MNGKANTGTVYLVGAGPGDPSLLTVRGAELLREADVVVYDALAASELLRLASPNAEKIDVGKRGNAPHRLPQEEINQLLVDLARAGKSVVRLKGGDPFVFGRGGEEASFLADAGIAFEVVPGVTASSSAPGYAGIPLTDRRHAASFAVVTGQAGPLRTGRETPWGALGSAVDTLVILMGMRNLRSIVAQVLEGGRDPQTPAAAVMWGATPRQKVVVAPLCELPEAVEKAGLTNPSTVVIGEVVNLRDALAWYEKRPLFGTRVLVTRTLEQAGEMIDLLGEAGAQAIVEPMIRIVDPESWEALDRSLSTLSEYEFVIFTSQNAVQSFVTRAKAQQISLAELNAEIVCVGPATAEIAVQQGLPVHRIPEKRFDAEGVLELFSKEDLSGKQVLIPSAAKVRAVLRDGLREAGATVDTPTAYRTLPPEIDSDSSQELRRKLVASEIDVLSFTSPSTVNHFLGLLDESSREAVDRCLIASIGPVTATALREADLEPHIIPDEANAQALVMALCSYMIEKHLGE